MRDNFLTVILVLSICANVFMGYKATTTSAMLAETSKILAKQEKISYTVTSNYYGLLQFIKDHDKKIIANSRTGGFFNKLFKSDEEMLDLSKWEDPLKEKE